MNNLIEVEIAVEICREDVILPDYARLYDAGMDVCAACDVDISPGETEIIPTGIKVAIPEGYEIQVRPRSGMSFKTPLRIPNSPGTIDAGYRDEIGIIMWNSAASSDNTQPYHISKGDRIAQLVLCQVPRIKFKLVDDVSEIGSNRGGGFGSSGK